MWLGIVVTRSHAPAKATTNNWSVVMPYEVAFQGFSSELASVLEGLGKLEGLHEEVGADDVVVVEGAPAIVAVLVAELALRGEEVGVLG